MTVVHQITVMMTITDTGGFLVVFSKKSVSLRAGVFFMMFCWSNISLICRVEKTRLSGKEYHNDVAGVLFLLMVVYTVSFSGMKAGAG